MNEKEVLMEHAVLGRQVESFFMSDVGAYLLHRADEEKDAAMEALKKCNARELEELQNIVWRAESIRTWLEEAVIAGQSALDILEDREDG